MIQNREPKSSPPHLCLHGHDFVLELARCLRRRRLGVRPSGEGVLRGPGGGGERIRRKKKENVFKPIGDTKRTIVYNDINQWKI